jgi:hypothetical protein
MVGVRLFVLLGGGNFDSCLHLNFKSSMVFPQFLLQICYLSQTKPDIKCAHVCAHAHVHTQMGGGN